MRHSTPNNLHDQSDHSKTIFIDDAASRYLRNELDIDVKSICTLISIPSVLYYSDFEEIDSSHIYE